MKRVYFALPVSEQHNMVEKSNGTYEVSMMNRIILDQTLEAAMTRANGYLSTQTAGPGTQVCIMEAIFHVESPAIVEPITKMWDDDNKLVDIGGNE